MNNQKIYKKCSLYLILTFILTIISSSCTNEDLSDNNRKRLNSAEDKNLTTFVSSPSTRISIDYNNGKYKWTKGDRIFVQDDNGIWQQSTNAVDEDNVASFKFKVPGKFGGKNSYKVLYLGENANSNQVVYPNIQQQDTPNSSSHLGKSGDWGTAIAKKGTGIAYEFRIKHKSTILVLQPYNANSRLEDCYIYKVEISSDNDVVGTYSIDHSTETLKNDGTGKVITVNTNSRNSALNQYPNGFPIKEITANIDDNGTYVVMKPGVHKLTIKYYIQDVFTKVSDVITKHYPSFDYKENTYYPMPANLKILNFSPMYYMWDAKQNYWYPHQWGTTDVWQPKVSAEIMSSYAKLPGDSYNNNYPREKDTAPDRWYNDSYPGENIRNDAQTALFKQLPNANEMAWYCLKGDPHIDKDKLYSFVGHLWKGGMWFLKKEKISGFSTEQTPDGKDCRLLAANTYYHNSAPVATPPAAARLSDYFFLPALGYSYIGRMVNVGFSGYFYSSSARPKNGNDGSPYAIALSFRGETKYDFQVYVEAIYRIKACRTHVFGMTEGQ